MQKSILSLTLFFLFLSGFSFGQEPGLTIVDLNTCQDSIVSIQIEADDLSDVGAMSLFIKYNEEQLNFMDIENVHPDFQNLKWNAYNTNESIIAISWINVLGASFESNILFELKFNYNGQAGSLEFLSQCEIVTTALEIVPVNFSDGLISPVISVMEQPNDTSVVPPAGLEFFVDAAGASSFQWQISYDGGNSYFDLEDDSIYQDVNTRKLIIMETDIPMDGAMYRCEIFEDDCEVYTQSAILTLDGVGYQDILLPAGWSSLSTYLSPLNTDMESVFETIQGSLVILFNDDGFYYPELNINTIGEFDPSKGYALKLTQNSSLSLAGLKTNGDQVSLPEGWSYLPIRVNCNKAISDIFGELIADVIIIKEIAGNNLYWSEKDIFTLQILEPGKSYLIKTANPIILTFPMCD